MVSRLIRNQLPFIRLRVRVPCPPLWQVAKNRNLPFSLAFGEKGNPPKIAGRSR